MFGKPHEIDSGLYSTKIVSFCGIVKPPKNPSDPQFGIEIEAENFTRIPKIPLDAAWQVTHDGSLRNNGVEYVTEFPVTLDKGKKLLSNFEAYSKDMNLDFSERTSVHVHFNAADWTFEDLHKFAVIYYLIENPFTQAAGGEERVGNRFCLRAVDANEIVTRFKNFLRVQDYNMFDPNGDRRYLALNYSSFYKFGSLEFRAHKGTNSADTLSSYLEAIAELREVKNNFTSAVEIIETYSAYGITKFLRTFLPKTMNFMLRTLSEKQIEEQITDSYYIAQDIAYCVRVVTNVKEEVKPPKKLPLGRVKMNPRGFYVDDTMRINTRW